MPVPASSTWSVSMWANTPVAASFAASVVLPEPDGPIKIIFFAKVDILLSDARLAHANLQLVASVKDIGIESQRFLKLSGGTAEIF